MPNFRRNRVPGAAYFFTVPDHMHCIRTLPESDSDFPARWRAIKTAFSKSLPNVEQRSSVMIRRGERGIWQRRYWEHTIRDDQDYSVHLDYVHFNPVKHGLVGKPGDWPYSTFHRCVATGLYPSDWMGAKIAPRDMGERF